MLLAVLGSSTHSYVVKSVLLDQRLQFFRHATAFKYLLLVHSNQLAGLANKVLGNLGLA